MTADGMLLLLLALARLTGPGGMILGGHMEFTYTVKVTLKKQGKGPKADREYLAEEVRSQIEESVDGESFYDDEDTEYLAESTVSEVQEA